MINYSYTINQMYTLSVPTEPYYVVQINYTYTGTDGQFASSINNSVFYQVMEESAFIPYEDLTQEIVERWIESYVGLSGIENYQQSIADQIELQKNPPVTPESQPLPWEQTN